MARRFVAAGHTLAPGLEAADLHVVNSCTVTHLAARDSRKLARRGGRLNPVSLAVTVGGLNVHELSSISLRRVSEFVGALELN